MISDNSKIRLTQKGAAWLALRESGFITSDSTETEEEKFELFWDKFSEHQMPFIEDIVENGWENTEHEFHRGKRLGTVLGGLIGMSITALAIAVYLFA